MDVHVNAKLRIDRRFFRYGCAQIARHASAYETDVFEISDQFGQSQQRRYHPVPNEAFHCAEYGKGKKSPFPPRPGSCRHLSIIARAARGLPES